MGLERLNYFSEVIVGGTDVVGCGVGCGGVWRSEGFVCLELKVYLVYVSLDLSFRL